MARDEKPVKYGIIGTGLMGQHHIGSIKPITDIQIVAVADPHQPSLEAAREALGEPGILYFENYADLLKCKDVDAALIVTPDFTHVKITCDALRMGKHVLCEKPAATSRQDLDRLEEAVGKSDRVYQVGLECRSTPVYQKIRELLDRGAVGQPRMMWCHEFRDPFLSKVGEWIHFQEKTGGVFVEKCCHYFDLFNWFAGSLPRKVTAFAGQDVIKEIYGIKPDVFDNGWVIVEFENHVRANLGLSMFSWNGPEKNFFMEFGILGDSGTLMHEQRDAGPTIQIVNARDNGRTNMVVSPPAAIEKLSHMGGVYYEHLAFIDCIRTGRKPFADVVAARWSVAPGLAAEEAARTGRIVELT